MKRPRLLLWGVLFSLAAVAAQATVLIGVREGKRFVYNDGVGESPREALGQGDGWLAARMAVPSLYDALIDDAARRHSVDPRLVKSVMLIESGFNPSAISRKGARGLMQLMPQTASQYGAIDAFDPVQNVVAGARHLAYLLGVYGGNLPKSLAAYNAGEAAVERYGGIPPYPETQLYVRKGLIAYYGKPLLGGGFGLPADQIRARKGRPVRLLRDRNNRPLLTTNAPSRPPLHRS
jgi:soluble lytic murein transglycosylase-like protein